MNDGHDDVPAPTDEGPGPRPGAPRGVAEGPADASAGDGETPRGWRLLALDLDGTLLGPDGRVGVADVEAVARARDAGLEVQLAASDG